MAQAMHPDANGRGRYGPESRGDSVIDRGLDTAEQTAEAVDMHRKPFDAKVDQVTEDIFGAEEERGPIRAASAASFRRVATMAVTLLVVIYIVAQLEGSFEVNDSSQFSGAYDTTVGLIGDTFTLMAITLIVAVAGLILYYVGGFGGGGGGNGGGGRFR